ncbi:MAG: hypothetical protein I8H68_03725 [Flavobacteriia bacterium]|nr:hypothetical protein [Flavobacteriia bacterium]MBH2023833.1 hypothetical protein [Flavobacteriales bacterium]
MKNLILPFLLFSSFFFGQQSSLKESAGLFPLYLVDGMITNEEQLKAFGTAEISAVSVYKSDNLPEKLTPFINFISEGIISITMKSGTENLESVSLERLNIQHQFDELNPVYINRIFVKNNTVKILKDAVIESEIIENNGQKFLNIWTVKKSERNGIVKRSGGIKLPPKEKSAVKNVILK